MEIRTLSEKKFIKARVHLIINDLDYQNLNFLDEGTLKRVQEFNAIKNKEKPEVIDLKQAFNL